MDFLLGQVTNSVFKDAMHTIALYLAVAIVIHGFLCGGLAARILDYLGRPVAPKNRE